MAQTPKTVGSKTASKAKNAAGKGAAGGAGRAGTSVGPGQYLQQVRQETRKVVWPTGREVYVTSIMVMIVLLLMGAFFFVVDWVLANGVQAILGFGT